METTKTTSRIHPLTAAAAVSVIVVSLAGTAAITGLLPSSHSAPEAGANTAQVNPAYSAAPTAAPALPMAAEAPQGTQPQQAAYAQSAVASAQPAPVVIKETVIKEVPAKPVHHTVHHANTSYAQNDSPSYREPAYREPAPRPAPQQPNYVAIGTGAVVGGLLGNQVGSGNGRKLATVAGMIGGGMLGNQIANQNQNQGR
ncbi:glycine zipper 2TM domain-containing protein [Massilia sp. TW-1]|uniref:Glycine zipper 2TM domain-containing protein n=1 Tax=Telluria antibiotica TaxID=2717319 RepID=A0ABX0PBY3_9BURK|nr:glycine zipper 2TM domain-containing protein [Telluria antibiotica]NIA54860.1 glycine zipper 2TM domain-containing protein [Telluria antibiotica]